MVSLFRYLLIFSFSFDEAKKIVQGVGLGIDEELKAGNYHCDLIFKRH